MIFREIGVVPDPQSPDVMILKLSLHNVNVSERALPWEFLLGDIVTIPEERIRDILAIVFQKGWKQRVDILSRQVFHFATDFVLSPISIEPEFVYYTTTVQNATNVAPYLVLDKIVKELAPPNYKLDRMLFQFPGHFASVSSLIAKTLRSAIQAVMMIVAYNTYHPYTLGYNNTEKERWEDICYKYIDRRLPWIAGKFFLDKAYSEEKRRFVDTLTEELKSTYLQRVLNLDWISDVAKRLIQEKLFGLIVKIGYHKSTPNATNATNLGDYYNDVNITDSLFNNALSIRHWDSDPLWNLLQRLVNKSVWPEIAGITQASIYYSEVPSYLSFSSTGMIAAHEMTHSLDTNGRLWNEKRQYRTWRDEKSIENFNNRKDCLINQYSDIRAVNHLGDPVFSTDGKPLFGNGSFTISENIADGGGLATNWEARVQHEKKEPSQLLPGLEGFTKQQLFFINFAQNWCSMETPSSTRENIQNGAHAPPFARVLGALQNSKGFSDACKCNTALICELW
ncbi:zincin [Periconia macrospinosa]|uniref:Zincin n=1 Tax=Periconia macrospinosa TaxID=97972 RepID=A0A2V1DTK3_9PLEO|nr:zincin [Periconia macrospinosa]